MVNVQAITIERLKEWGRDCMEDHATPALMLAIGHDEHQGEIHVYVPEDVDKDMLREFLLLAAAHV